MNASGLQLLRAQVGPIQVGRIEERQRKKDGRLVRQPRVRNCIADALKSSLPNSFRTSDKRSSMSDTDQYHVQPLGEDEGDYLSIVSESLMNYGEEIWTTYLDRLGRENVRSIHRSGQCVGGLTFYRMGHWFGGRSIPTAGISGVAISPADRGNGTCRYLLESVMREVYDEGFPLASLYASTQTLYRKIGFEQAGTQTLYSLPMSSITGGHDRSCPVERFKTPPLEPLERIAHQRAIVGNGQLQRTDGLWKRLFVPNDRLPTKCYLFGTTDQPEGYAILKANNPNQGVPQPLFATDLAVTSRRSLDRLLALIRDHRSIYNCFQWYGAANDPLLLAADEHRSSVAGQTRWMERILSVPAALSQRGYSPGVDVTLNLQIEDDLFPENRGNWQVRIVGGGAEVQAGGDGSLRMNVRALAPLFTSYYSAAELAQLGRIEAASDDQLSAADQAFAGPAPWMPEVF